MPDNPTLKELVAEALMARGFDGLYHEDGECGCRLEDLMPCSPEFICDCSAGYLGPLPADLEPHSDPAYNWGIWAEKNHKEGAKK